MTRTGIRYPGHVLEERTLLDGLREGVPHAFEELVRKHAGRMRATALRLLTNETDAEDAVQDAFLSALRSLGTFDGRAKLGTWLHRITINAVMMRLRARGVRNETALDSHLPEFGENGTFAAAQMRWHEGADTPALRDDLCRRVRSHIEELPDNYRIPLILRDLDELSHREIAEALDVSENAAKLRVHRARQALRDLIEPHLAEPA